MIEATNGPATNTGPMPGMAKKAAPHNNPQRPPQKAPCLPQYFMRSPTLLCRPGQQAFEHIHRLAEFLPVSLLHCLLGLIELRSRLA